MPINSSGTTCSSTVYPLIVMAILALAPVIGPMVIAYRAMPYFETEFFAAFVTGKILARIPVALRRLAPFAVGFFAKVKMPRNSRAMRKKKPCPARARDRARVPFETPAHATGCCISVFQPVQLFRQPSRRMFAAVA